MAIKHIIALFALLILCLGIVACRPEAAASTPTTAQNTTSEIKLERIMTGLAAWYDYDLKGQPNYSQTNYTAASRDFARGTMLRVCNVQFAAWPPLCVDVRVNDYGPEQCDKRKRDTCPPRLIDLSSAAFKKLAPLKTGLIKVTVTEIKKPNSKR